jgi:hypothetical protein
MVWLAVALSPLLVAAIVLFAKIGGRYRPGGDFATIELQIRDVGRHPVLIGLFSRSDWHHPGPAFFYLLAVPYRLLGSASVSVNAGALISNALAIAAMAYLAHRRGGIALSMCMLAGLSVMARASGADFVRSPWNPDLPVLPYGVLLLLVWSMICGDLWALPASTAVASFLIQTHVGFVVLAIPVCTVGLVAVVFEHGRRRSLRRLLWPAGFSLAIAAVMWLPPLIDQVANSPGNLRRVAHYFVSPDGPTHTFAEGWRVVTGEFGVLPEWVGGARPLGVVGLHPFVKSAPLPVLLLPFALAFLFVWRRRQRVALALGFVLLVALVSGVVAVMRTVGLIEAYRLRWTWLLACLALVFTAWVAWSAVRERWPHLERRVLVPVAGGVIIVATAASVADAITSGDPQPVWSAPIETISPQVLRALPPGPGVVLVRRPADFPSWWPGIVLALERRGVPVRVDSDPVNLLGKHRLAHGEPVRAVLTLASDGEAFADHPGARRVGLWTRCDEARVRGDLERLKVEGARYQTGLISGAQYLTIFRSLCTNAVAVYLSSPTTK